MELDGSWKWVLAEVEFSQNFLVPNHYFDLSLWYSLNRAGRSLPTIFWALKNTVLCSTISNRIFFVCANYINNYHKSWIFLALEREPQCTEQQSSSSHWLQQEVISIHLSLYTMCALLLLSPLLHHTANDEMYNVII